jgi:hypothetical protein
MNGMIYLGHAHRAILVSPENVRHGDSRRACLLCVVAIGLSSVQNVVQTSTMAMVAFTQYLKTMQKRGMTASYRTQALVPVFPSRACMLEHFSLHFTFCGIRMQKLIIQDLHSCCSASISTSSRGYRNFFGSFFGYIRRVATPETPALSLTKSVLKFRVVC